MEKIQQNVALTTIGAIRYISKEKLYYQELGIEALQQRQSYRKLCDFSKFLKINLHAICLIRLPNQNVTIKAEIVKNFFFPVNNIRMDN